MTEQLTKALRLIDQAQFGKDCVSNGVARGIVLDQLRALLTTALSEAEVAPPVPAPPVLQQPEPTEAPLTKADAQEVAESISHEEAPPIRERDFRIPLGSPKSPRTRKKPT